MSFMDRLEGRLGRWAVPRLITYVISGQAFFFFMEAWKPGVLEMTLLRPQRVLEGEAWRILAFPFMPPGGSPFMVVMTLIFYYMCGSSLEAVWGTFRFNVYYFLGLLGTAAAAFLTPEVPASNFYLNASLFLAYAAVFPEAVILFAFILPLRVKWLGLAEGAYFLWLFLNGDLTLRLATGASLLNFLVFFGIGWSRRGARKAASAAGSVLTRPRAVHACATCGLTELRNSDLEFRYCSDCDKEYCMSHLDNHTHA